MANDSATIGYLQPVDAIPYDDALEDLIQAVVVGVTGLAGDRVRPRWQQGTKPPPLPPAEVDWCAIGIVGDIVTDGDVAIEHDGDGDAGLGDDDLTNWETIPVLASFYGPNALSFATRFRDGLKLPQNREPMWINAGFVIGNISDRISNLPDQRNAQWVHRYDLPVTFRRATTRTYTVRNLVEAEITIGTDTGYVSDVTVIAQP